MKMDADEKELLESVDRAQKRPVATTGQHPSAEPWTLEVPTRDWSGHTTPVRHPGDPLCGADHDLQRDQQAGIHRSPLRGGYRESCGGPRYGKSSNRSRCGPTLSAVTLPFDSIEKNTSATSSVSVRPLCGKAASCRGS